MPDVFGVPRETLYRTFAERKWKPPQPMFNVLEVKEGEEATFEQFLSQAQVISGEQASNWNHCCQQWCSCLFLPAGAL